MQEPYSALLAAPADSCVVSVVSAISLELALYADTKPLIGKRFKSTLAGHVSATALQCTLVEVQLHFMPSAV